MRLYLDPEVFGKLLMILRWQTNLKDKNFILLIYYRFQSGDAV